jgi:hypothetical protein
VRYSTGFLRSDLFLCRCNNMEPLRMDNRRKCLTDTINVLVSLVRNVRSRRELHAACPEPHLNFWRVIYGNITDMAVLEWCKLFGSDDEENQPIHWKNIAPDPDSFRTALFSRLGIYESKWRSYWHEMKSYRDQSVAHHDHGGFLSNTIPNSTSP